MHSSHSLRRVLCLGIISAAITSAPPPASAQSWTSSPQMFGYFQNILSYYDFKAGRGHDYSSFSVQQLNVMLQKELSPRWTAFVNMEFVNSYSSSRLFGDFNLEEAWIRLRIGQRMSLKAGLLIPEFNRMNSIKTKMPLLPYIIRPLAYESSLAEAVAVEEYIPTRAFVTFYGHQPAGPLKIDHAVYVGNSPNVSTSDQPGQSGVDTSRTFLVGGRIGVRTESIHAGVSGSLDYYDLPAEVGGLIHDPNPNVREIPRYRLGVDARLTRWKVTLEGEMIEVWYDDDLKEIVADKDFYYGTVLFAASDRLTVFGGYWYVSQNFVAVAEGLRGFELVNYVGRLKIPTFGASYTLTDYVILKAHFGIVKEEVDQEGVRSREMDFNYYGFGTSVMF